MKESAFLRMRLHLLEQETVGENPQKFTGEALGLLKEDTKVRNDGAGPDVVEYGLEVINIQANDGADLDNAISSAKAALEAALIASGKDVGPTTVDKKDELLKALGKKLDVRLRVTAEGRTVEGMICRAAETLEGSFHLDKDGFVINGELTAPKKDK